MEEDGTWCFGREDVYKSVRRLGDDIPETDPAPPPQAWPVLHAYYPLTPWMHKPQVVCVDPAGLQTRIHAALREHGYKTAQRSTGVVAASRVCTHGYALLDVRVFRLPDQKHTFAVECVRLSGSRELASVAWRHLLLHVFGDKQVCAATMREPLVLPADLCAAADAALYVSLFPDNMCTWFTQGSVRTQLEGVLLVLHVLAAHPRALDKEPTLVAAMLPLVPDVTYASALVLFVLRRWLDGDDDHDGRSIDDELIAAARRRVAAQLALLTTPDVLTQIRYDDDVDSALVRAWMRQLVPRDVGARPRTYSTKDFAHLPHAYVVYTAETHTVLRQCMAVLARMDVAEWHVVADMQCFVDDMRVRVCAVTRGAFTEFALDFVHNETRSALATVPRHVCGDDALTQELFRVWEAGMEGAAPSALPVPLRRTGYELLASVLGARVEELCSPLMCDALSAVLDPSHIATHTLARIFAAQLLREHDAPCAHFDAWTTNTDAMPVAAVVLRRYCAGNVA